MRWGVGHANGCRLPEVSRTLPPPSMAMGMHFSLRVFCGEQRLSLAQGTYLPSTEYRHRKMVHKVPPFCPPATTAFRQGVLTAPFSAPRFAFCWPVETGIRRRYEVRTAPTCEPRMRTVQSLAAIG
jgi:hypothetical protein